MTNVVKFESKKPEPVKGPMFAGRPLKEAFPQFNVERSPHLAQVVIGGECYILIDDEPNGAA